MSFQGSTRSKNGPDADGLQPEVGSQAPDAVLTDTDGNSVTLSSYWKVKPTVILFLRHFGCPFCREQVANLRKEFLKFETAGAQIVCVGQGPYKAGKGFSILMDLPFPVLVCGDDLTVYEQYGLTRGTFKQILNVNVFMRGFTAIKNGIGLGPVEGDSFQMPGAFVVDTAGTVLLAHRSVDQSDNISPSELLKVIRPVSAH